MIKKTKAWLLAIRVKTLLAGLSPCILALSLVVSYNLYRFDGEQIFDAFLNLQNIFLLLVMVIVSQISTNLCNDYFDAKRGVDNENRLGPTRVMQHGYLSDKEMIFGIVISFLIPLLIGIYFAFIVDWRLFVITILGLLISFLYTGGRFPLAYYGLGDIFAFCIFGPILVNVSFFIFTQIFLSTVFLYSLISGAFAVMLIGVNNYRDIENDKAHRKYTLAVLLGKTFCKWEYLIFALMVSWLPLLGSFFHFSDLFLFNPFLLGITMILFTFFFIPLVINLWQEKIHLFNKVLAKTAFLYFFYHLCFAMIVILSSL